MTLNCIPTLHASHIPGTVIINQAFITYTECEYKCRRKTLRWKIRDREGEPQEDSIDQTRDKTIALFPGGEAESGPSNPDQVEANIW